MSANRQDMKRNECMVTGGSGFLGSHIVHLLLRRGYEVTVIDDLSTGNKKLIEGENVNFILKDITDPNIVKVVKRKRFKYVFNFASPSTDRVFNLDGSATVNTFLGMLNSFKIAKACQAEKVIYPSSGTVYGNSPAPQGEDLKASPLTMYACTKLLLENISSLLGEECVSVGLRIFAGYGGRERFKGGHASVVTLFHNDLTRGQPPVIYGDGEQRRDYIHSLDIAEIAIRAAESNTEGVLNAGCGISYSMNELVETLSKELSVNVKPKYVESPLRHIQETRADTTRLERVLGYKPMGLDDGIRLLIKELSAFS